jgi:hypothetical protein
VLQWAREHECDWDLMTCARAAEGGYLEMLRLAREHGCPWDERTCALPRRAARAPEGAAVGAGAPLPVGLVDGFLRRCVGAPGGGAVGVGTQLRL